MHRFRGGGVSLRSLTSGSDASTVSYASPAMGFGPSSTDFQRVILRSAPVFFTDSYYIVRHSFDFPHGGFVSISVLFRLLKVSRFYSVLRSECRSSTWGSVRLLRSYGSFFRVSVFMLRFHGI